MKSRNYLVLLVVTAAIFSMIGCNDNYSRTDTRITAYAADGLDLKAVGELLKTAKDAEDLEQKLNKPGGVNNLDLDEDGKVDFIKVTGDDQKGIRVMKLTAVLSGSGDLQDVATIEIEKSGDKADVQIRGNEQVYGSNHYYHSNFGLTDALILYWLFGRSYRPYYSPWGWGSYPGYYGRGYAPVPVRTYRSRTGRLDRNSTFSRSSRNRLSRKVAPSSRNVSSRVKAPLKRPTTSQKAFQARNPSKQVRRGGFGSRSTRTTRSSRFSRSRSSRFGK